MIFLENVGVTYPNGFVAVEGVSVELARGEFTVLLGSSGAGKSTLLGCINYLTAPTTGRILVEGLGDIKNPKVLREHRRRTGTIFQQHQLIERNTALQNVLLGRLAYYSTIRSLLPLPKKERYLALDCLERVGLFNKALNPVKALSGGEKQRIGIARALAQQPQFILADEPVASLDPASSRKVLSFLRQICREDGLGLLVSLHQVELAIEYADRILGVAQGKVVFDGGPKELKSFGLEEIYKNLPLTTTS
ncbi:phosphonate ABC transporter ATP-binding protein [Crocosphaera sp. Alani8]|uniref:phosphonate ABC transporter ATP-binding protein n=1 Tax=Crocosphaera sp. Alani8 TaxID=3038952 RepID=UPI00313F26A9